MARQWFTPETCENLTHTDCAFLNRAVRWCFPHNGQAAPTHLQLMSVRMSYTPGMSVFELLNAAGLWENR